ncbi:sugar ABC transporter ATP-binding protein [Anaerotalea alkaliphila]|uniref:Ribose/galactose/methyl galactoside import ATP-binding protein n=1 Tax=Anaerotalea alkaliphila TaxID=2662126 RepID=A0A7X5HYB0_9FIRM|nr:sugar ABC transporter ATP-binding protein [Anaerotalea alkaliphila]NDL68756.1 sugar ABC transporter ATP-binding protein [Anaerotalea alkaliphila]
MNNEFILEMNHISKTFPGVKALEDVQLKVRKGTVHALMGENGAGKSTLMKILIGIQPADAGGELIYKGKPVTIQSTNDALGMGISMIHQELSPIPHMTIAENIFLGRESTKGKTFWVDDEEMNRKAVELFKQLDIELDPRKKMKELSIANTQMVEIAKAISYNSELIIMDEPTSAITEKEVNHLFTIIRGLREKGVSIIYISHKMDEIFRISDDITVFRDGQYVTTKRADELDNNKLISLMVGRELKAMFPKEEVPIGEVLMEVKNFTRKGYFEDVSFQVRRGEILGFAGLMGAGRTEVMEALFGVTQKDAGEVYVEGKKIEIKTPKDAIANKLALLTEDRKLTGCFLPLSIRDNIAVASIDKYRSGLLINPKKINDECGAASKKLNVKTPSLDQLIKNLSGGNQQKVLIARWLQTDPDILIIDEPTRGIDVGAKSEIHKLMSALAKQGKAVIMVSSELPEILGMSDRVIVMHNGKIKGELDRSEATQERVMEYAIG